MLISTKPAQRRALRQGLPVVAALATLGFALTACGGDNEGASAATNAPATAAPTTTQPAAAPSTPTGSTPRESAPAASATGGSQPVSSEPDPLAYSQCMRDHGITNFPDPDADGGLALDGETLGIEPDSPQYQAADEACKHLLIPPGGAAGPSQEGIEAMLAYAQCMRDEGITAFPDPNPETGLELDGDAVGIDTPQFQAADEACQHLMGEGGSTNEQGGQ
jgi:hypothetical protein